MPADARLLSYSDAIREGLDLAMARDPSVILIGEGVPDPKAIFGTTVGLLDKYGAERVFDMPLAENGLTGICIGAAMSGLRPVMVHQRIDFALLAMDQLVNNAAKWSYMFAGQVKVPLVVRLIVGRGWGQGPQHSQSLQSLFAHIPGLRVVMPVTAGDAKGMLAAAIAGDEPVLFIEHRWLHGIRDSVPQGYYETPLDRARVLRKGEHLTVAAFSYMSVEAVQAAAVLAELGITLEVVDMRSARPLDMAPVLDSVRRTGHLLVADTGHPACGLAAEVIARTTAEVWGNLRQAPRRITAPDIPAPTSHYAAADYYPGAGELVRAALDMLGQDSEAALAQALARLPQPPAKDVPNPGFTGPF